MYSSRGVSLFLALKFGNWGAGGCYKTYLRLQNLGVVSRLDRVEELNHSRGHPGHFPRIPLSLLPLLAFQVHFSFSLPATSISCLQLHVRGGVGRKEKFQSGERSGLPEFKTRPFLSFSPAGFPGMFCIREAWDGALKWEGRGFSSHQHSLELHKILHLWRENSLSNPQPCLLILYQP